MNAIARQSCATSEQASGETGSETSDGAEPLRYEVDGIDEQGWNALLTQFSDATIHQTVSWGRHRWGEDKLSRIVVYAGSRPVAAAQLVIVRVPLLGAGVAHCKFGPMWRLWGEPEDARRYAFILEAMREAFAEKAGLLLRVKPWEPADSGERTAAVRRAAGLRQREGGEKYETFLIDMSYSLDSLRAGFASKWRYNLKKTEQRNLEIRCSVDSQGAALFMQNYDEMRSIKSYVENSEVDILPNLMSDLPEGLRPTVFTALIDGQPAASIVISHIGRIAYYLFGATGRLGRESGASYVLFWQALQWLKQRDCGWFDLVGSRPDVTAGQRGYRQFKAGLVGRNGSEVAMSDWEACSSIGSRIVVTGGDRVRGGLLAVKQRLNALSSRVVPQTGG